MKRVMMRVMLSSRPSALAREPGPKAKHPAEIRGFWVPDVPLARNSGMTVDAAREHA
jgi:hypothetical protein